MQSTNSEYGSPYLATHHFPFLYCHFIQDLNLSVLIYHFNCTGIFLPYVFYHIVYHMLMFITVYYSHTTHCLYKKKIMEKKSGILTLVSVLRGIMCFFKNSIFL